jgi:outer membrane protein assembly factor BamE (lipoprotein component of BamABCDE complex)
MRIAIIFAAGLLLSGCVFSHHSHLKEKGAYVAPETVVQIEVGQTDRDWVLANLGTPDRIHAEKDGLEIFEYVSRTVKKSDNDFIFLFSWESERVVQQRVTRVVLRERIVESVTVTEG